MTPPLSAPPIATLSAARFSEENISNGSGLTSVSSETSLSHVASPDSFGGDSYMDPSEVHRSCLDAENAAYSRPRSLSAHPDLRFPSLPVTNDRLEAPAQRFGDSKPIHTPMHVEASSGLHQQMDSYNQAGLQREAQCTTQAHPPGLPPQVQSMARLSPADSVKPASDRPLPTSRESSLLGAVPTSSLPSYLQVHPTTTQPSYHRNQSTTSFDPPAGIAHPPAQAATSERRPGDSGSARAKVGRPSKAEEQLLKAAFKKMDDIVHDLASQTGLSFSDIVSRWDAREKAVHGRKSMWNVYQNYFTHHRAEELSRLSGEQYDPRQEVETKHIACAYDAFRAAYPSDWLEFLDTWDKYVDAERTSAITQQQRSARFHRSYNQMKKLAENLSSRDATQVVFAMVGEVVHEDHSNARVFATPGLEGFIERFFFGRDTDKFLGYAKAFVYNNIAEEMILADCQNFVTARSHQGDGSSGSRIVPPAITTQSESSPTGSSTSRVKVEDHATVDMRNDRAFAGQLRDKLAKLAQDVGLTISQPGFPWKKFAPFIAKNGYVLRNYPNNVRLPHDSCSEKTSKGVENLTMQEKTLFLAQIDDGTYPVHFFQVTSASDVISGKIPVITRAPPGPGQSGEQYFLPPAPISMSGSATSRGKKKGKAVDVELIEEDRLSLLDDEEFQVESEEDEVALSPQRKVAPQTRSRSRTQAVMSVKRKADDTSECESVNKIRRTSVEPAGSAALPTNSASPAVNPARSPVKSLKGTSVRFMQPTQSSMAHPSTTSNTDNIVMDLSRSVKPSSEDALSSEGSQLESNDTVMAMNHRGQQVELPRPNLPFININRSNPSPLNFNISGKPATTSVDSQPHTAAPPNSNLQLFGGAEPQLPPPSESVTKVQLESTPLVQSGLQVPQGASHLQSSVSPPQQPLPPPHVSPLQQHTSPRLPRPRPRPPPPHTRPHPMQHPYPYMQYRPHQRRPPGLPHMPPPPPNRWSGQTTQAPQAPVSDPPTSTSPVLDSSSTPHHSGSPQSYAQPDYYPAGYAGASYDYDYDYYYNGYSYDYNGYPPPPPPPPNYVSYGRDTYMTVQAAGEYQAGHGAPEDGGQQ